MNIASAHKDTSTARSQAIYGCLVETSEPILRAIRSAYFKLYNHSKVYSLCRTLSIKTRTLLIICKIKFVYSHSIVDGGLEVMSYTTRLTPFTSLQIRVEIFSNTSYGIRAQSAVIPSIEVTARIPIV